MSRKASPVAPRMLSLPAALVSVFVAISQLNAATAQSVPASSTAGVQRYEIPAGPLAQTLEAIASASGRSLSFDRQQLGGLNAPAVNGNYGVAGALGQALAGTGYAFNEENGGVIKVVPALTVIVTAKRDEAETSFKASRSDTATRSGADLHDVPAAITLITSKVLETQQTTNLQDALRNVSGVTFSQSPQGAPRFAVRGMDASGTVNGVTDTNAASLNVFGVERVEVLKGPQAILSGGNSEGGGVNVVMKKPQADLIRDFTVQLGSNADRTIAADLSGPVTDDKRLTYRLIGSVADASRSSSGFNGRKDRGFIPAVRWKDERTDVIMTASYAEAFNPLVHYTFARRDGVILPAVDMLMGNRSDGIDTINKKINYQFEHKFSPTLAVISRMQRATDVLDLHVWAPFGLEYDLQAPSNMPNGSVTFFPGQMKFHERTLSGDHYLRWSVRTGAVLHKLSIGVSHVDQDFTQTQSYGNLLTTSVYPASKFNFLSARAASDFGSRATYGQTQKAMYLQETAIFGNWTAQLNLRRSDYRMDAGATYVAGIDDPFTSPKERFLVTTPGIGIVYKLNETTSLYSSYAEGFSPNSTVLCTGGRTPPLETKNKEIGAKFDLLNSKLALTTSVFSLQKSNTLDYDTFANCFFARDGQRTQGVEIDMQGQLAPGVDLVMNYTLSNLKDVKDPSAVFNAVPKHKFSTWAVFRFPQERLRGLGLGMGINANSSTLGTKDKTYPFTIPGQIQLDASVFYETGPWNVIFGVKNLADRTLYGSTSDSSFVPLLPGRQFMLTVKHSFK